MAVLMATGHAVHVPHSLLDSVRTLTANIAAELGEASAGSDHYRVLFLTGTLLFVITFAVNLAADLAIRGVRETVTRPVAAPRVPRSSPGRRTSLRAERRQAIAKWVTFAMAVSMILPLVAIVGYLLFTGRHPRCRGSSWSTCRARVCARAASGRRSSARSTWSGSSLAVSAPIGVLAAIYLHEYAKDNWFNRAHQPGGHQPGRRAEHRARAVRPRRLRLRRAVRLLRSSPLRSRSRS